MRQSAGLFPQIIDYTPYAALPDRKNSARRILEFHLIYAPTEFLSNEIWISGEEDVTDARLYFPIPYCERSEHTSDGRENRQ